MALNTRGGVGKPAHKRSSKTSGISGSKASKTKKSSNLPKPKPVQQKSKPLSASNKSNNKKKPPHLRYTEKELKVPQLNGILPAGVQKAPNAKKGKNFVDDKESMNTILALVMAEREGNIESKMIRARQLEEVREARRVEAEKRTQSKKQGLEDRKQDIKDEKKARKRGSSETKSTSRNDDGVTSQDKKKSSKKRVSFG